MSTNALKSQRWKNLCAELKYKLPPVCWICGNFIDLSLSGRDPMGWTLDHVKPRATHPHLTYDKSNLRPAHHKCNSLRGASEIKAGHSSRKYG